METLGLHMHVGMNSKTSKPESVCFPSRTTIQNWLLKHEKSMLPSPSHPISDPTQRIKKYSFNIIKFIIDRFYDKASSTDNIVIDYGFITFTRNLKSLR